MVTVPTNPPADQTRFVGTVHCDGGFTFGDPTNPTVVTGTAGAHDQSNPPLIGMSLADPTATFKQVAKEVAESVVHAAIVPQANIADLTAAPTAADFNHLLATLRAAGVLKA